MSVTKEDLVQAAMSICRQSPGHPARVAQVLAHWLSVDDLSPGYIAYRMVGDILDAMGGTWPRIKPAPDDDDAPSQ